MGLEHTALPISWGRIGPECLNLTVPSASIGVVHQGTNKTDPARLEARIYLALLGPTEQIL